MEYQIKTKEMKPKVYAMMLHNPQMKMQVIKLVLAYSFEDAVQASREAIARNYSLSQEQILGFNPALYEGIPAERIIDFLVEGKEEVISDTNAIMQRIVDTKDKAEAEDLLKKNKSRLPKTSVQYLQDEIDKKKDNKDKS